jgi:hypothetical protein
MSKENQPRKSPALWVTLVGAITALIALIVGLFTRRVRRSRKKAQTERSFLEAGVTVSVQQQSRPVLIVERSMAPLEDLHSDHDEFTPGQLLVNFEIVDAENPEAIIATFDPPITVKFAYSEAAVLEAQKLSAGAKRSKPQSETIPMPLFGFWDGTHWVLFTAEKHRLTYTPNELPGTGGTATVTLYRWADPPTGVWPRG